jgi:hypothetical protein
MIKKKGIFEHRWDWSNQNYYCLGRIAKVLMALWIQQILLHISALDPGYFAIFFIALL